VCVVCVCVCVCVQFEHMQHATFKTTPVIRWLTNAYCFMAWKMVML